MKIISGWIGVFLIFISLSLHLLMITNKNTKIKQLYYLIFIQIIIIFASIFWIIYAFKGQEIYWKTGISNIIIEILN